MAATTLLALAFFSFYTLFCSSSPTAVSDIGFTLDLIHRDSPPSPFYNPSETRAHRLRKALTRSFSRSARLLGPSTTLRGPVAGDPASHIFSNSGEYLTNLSLGTPGFEIMGVMDTGSDLLWTQCRPCEDCYKQSAPLFDPEASSTYRAVSCDSSNCKSLPQTGCDPFEGEICEYHYSYGDQSVTFGNLAQETLTLSSSSGRPVSFPRTLIGCGHHNEGTFGDKASGVIGLGNGAVSLVSQMGKAGGGKFSYCLVPLSHPDKPGHLNFGTKAKVSGPRSVSTPLVQKPPKTFYHITLEAVSVGKSRIPVRGPGKSSVPEGNIVIDSGTTLTLLPESTYKEIETAVAKLVKLERVPDPLEILSLCFKIGNADVAFEAPAITFHFKGADVALGTLNTFIMVADDVACLAFKPSDVDVSLYGNIAQMNFLVGYDVERKTISFLPSDCTNV